MEIWRIKVYFSRTDLELNNSLKRSNIKVNKNDIYTPHARAYNLVSLRFLRHISIELMTNLKTTNWAQINNSSLQLLLLHYPPCNQFKLIDICIFIDWLDKDTVISRETKFNSIGAFPTTSRHDPFFFVADIIKWRCLNVRIMIKISMKHCKFSNWENVDQIIVIFLLKPKFGLSHLICTHIPYEIIVNNSICI